MTRAEAVAALEANGFPQFLADHVLEVRFSELSEERIRLGKGRPNDFDAAKTPRGPRAA